MHRTVGHDWLVFELFWLFDVSHEKSIRTTIVLLAVMLLPAVKGHAASVIFGYSNAFAPTVRRDWHHQPPGRAATL